MPTILRNMRIKRVAFVDEGANPEAHIRFAKNKETQAEDTATEDLEKGFGKWILSRLAKAFNADTLSADDTQKSDDNTPKGDTEEMEINKINDNEMTPEDKAKYDDLVKKYGIAEAQKEPAAIPPTAETQPEQPTQEGTGDVYKGIHPKVKAELERLRKFREDTEDAQLLIVAKKYELLGRKPEELAPILKNLKAAGGTAYSDMISLMDSNLVAVEKSGMFSEIGKRGGDSGSDPWAKIELAATEIVKSKPDLRWADAIDIACSQNPELLDAYEKNRY